MSELYDFTLRFEGREVPAHLRVGLIRYLEEGVPTGGFLEAVLSNDLREAIGRADLQSREGLLALVGWLHMEAPAVSHGSADRYRCWLAAHKLAAEGGDLEAAQRAIWEERGCAYVPLAEAYGQVRTMRDGRLLKIRIEEADQRRAEGGGA